MKLQNPSEVTHGRSLGSFRIRLAMWLRGDSLSQPDQCEGEGCWRLSSVIQPMTQSFLCNKTLVKLWTPELNGASWLVKILDDLP